MPSFADKVVLITGTAHGCGAVLAEAFAEAGATVVGCDVDPEPGQAVAERIRAAGGRMDFRPADVSREFCGALARSFCSLFRGGFHVFGFRYINIGNN